DFQHPARQVGQVLPTKGPYRLGFVGGDDGPDPREECVVDRRGHTCQPSDSVEPQNRPLTDEASDRRCAATHATNCWGVASGPASPITTCPHKTEHSTRSANASASPNGKCGLAINIAATPCAAHQSSRATVMG